MDLFHMAKVSESINLIGRLNFIFQATFLKFGDLLEGGGGGSWQPMKNFSSIALKLYLLGQKKTQGV